MRQDARCIEKIAIDGDRALVVHVGVLGSVGTDAVVNAFAKVYNDDGDLRITQGHERVM